MFVNGIVQSRQAGSGDQLIIPQSAVLWTGPRSVVYVKLPGADHPTFKMREITLGSSMKDSYVVMDGLAAGEEIVTNGTFSMDAAAQLAGKVSMMNPGGEKASTGHDHANTKQMTQSQPLSNDGTLENQNFKASGECEMCKERIETAAKSVAGVTTAEWTAQTQMLHVQFDARKTNADAIQKAVSLVGHDTEKYKSPNTVYSQLPECCLYRK
jgi:Cu(I)/Ag(I) efflux system membrane fusion protein